MTTDNNHAGSQFTGKIFYPVVRRIKKEGVDIEYRCGVRQELLLGDDISLPIEAHEKRNNLYDIWVMDRRVVADAVDFDKAKEVMGQYIDSEGRLIAPKTSDEGGLEKETKKFT